MAEILCPLCNKIVTFDNICKCIFSKNCKNAYLLPKLKDFDKKNSKNNEAIDGFIDHLNAKTRKLRPEFQQIHNEEFETFNGRKNENKNLNNISCGYTKNRKSRYLSDETSNNEQLQNQCKISYFVTKSHFCKNKVYSNVVPTLRSSENVELGCKNRNDSNSNQKIEPISAGRTCKRNLFETNASTSTNDLSSDKGEMSCIKSKAFSFSIDKILSKTLPNVVSQKNRLDPEKSLSGKANFSFNLKFSTAFKESSEVAIRMSDEPGLSSILQPVATKLDIRIDNLVTKEQETINTLKESNTSLVLPERHTNLRAHSGGKPFACNICKKGFNFKSVLNRHYLVHTNEKPFVCEVCGQRFKIKCHLSRHYQIHTDEKPFICDVCEKRFTLKYHLRRHYQVHTNVKPYTCDKCEKGFTQEYHLRRHYRLHTNEKPFVCDVCEKRFRRKDYLAVHYRKHTIENAL